MSLRYEARGSAVVLTVDRPETRNAIDPSVHDALSDALDRVEDSDARVVILTGAGGAFISGGDLKLIRERPFRETLELSRRMSALLERVEALELPVLAAIEGPAYGGGCEVALACDMRLAAPSATLSFRQAAMGLTTGWGATTRLARLVGRGTATRLLMTAEIVEASDAARLGLIDEVADDPLARALAIAESIAAQSPRAVGAFKRLLSIAYGADTETSRTAERNVFGALWGGADHAEALEAYFAKRPPRWSP